MLVLTGDSAMFTIVELGADGWIILKWMLKKWDAKAWHNVVIIGVNFWF
jgi:hypothetical protein